MKKLNKKILLILCAISNLDINILNAKKKYDADYIIVGLGTAGAVLARYLSDPVNGCYKNRVLVLEEGVNRSRDSIVTNGFSIDNNFTELLINTGDLAYNPKYAKTQAVYEPNEGVFKEQILVNGKGWFGSSAINLMDAARGTADIYDEIAKIAGNDRWTYNNLLPFMKHLEHFYPNSTTEVISPQRGLHGPLKITQFSPLDQNNSFIKAIHQVTKAPFLPDYNVSTAPVCISPFQAYAHPETLKRSFAYDFLPESILSSDGYGKKGRKLRVISNAQVDKVLFKCKNGCKKAIGVRYINKEGCAIDVFAKKKIILCAGCPFSSIILQKSGIGPKSLLERLDIPIIVQNEQVGKHLLTQFCVLAAVSGELSGIGNSPLLHVWLDGYPTFVDTPDNIRRFQFIGISGLLIPNAVLTAYNIVDRTLGFTIEIANLRKKGYGYAEIVDKGPGLHPKVVFNVYENPYDQKAAIDNYKMLNKIVEQANINAGYKAYSMIYPPESHFTAPNSDQLLLLDAQAMLIDTFLSEFFHYTGTCHMGTSIENGVVDGNLHVFGVKNLMVADNSIYPLIETGNTAWTAYLAGIIAANILGWKLPSAEAKNIDLQESETLAESANLNMNQMSD